MNMKTLVRRSITGLIFAIIVLGLIIINSFTLHLFIWLLAILSFVEYLQIRFASKGFESKYWVIGFFIGPMLMLLNYFKLLEFSPDLPLIVIAVLYHLYLGGRVFFNFKYVDQKFNVYLVAFLYILFPLILLNHYLLHFEKAMELMLNLILTIWAADSFAYLIGSMLGRTKLLPAVSPKKSVEGAIGGLAFALLVAYLLYLYIPIASLAFHFGLGFVIWFFGLWGDLVESHLKRHYNLKDSGSILPGHGGFLDRFDAFLFMLPFVLLYLQIFG